MKLKLPKDLAAISDEELETLLTAAISEYTELDGIAEDELTDEQINDLEQLSEAVDQIGGEQQTRAEKAEQRQTRAATAKAKLAAAAVKDEEAEEAAADDEQDEDEQDDEAEEDAEADADADAEVEEREPVAASAARRSAVRTATLGRRKTDTTPKGKKATEVETGFSINVAADVPNYSSGQALGSDWDELAKAFMGRTRGMRGRRDVGQASYGVANLAKPKNEFALTERSSVAEQLAVLDAVSNERRLPQGGLMAAGGWCAPSETLYDFQGLETASGLVSLPEFSVTHGGINFTKGPLYSDLTSANNFGFTQTETQAEAGATKPIFAITCPDWEEVRMDAVGFGIRAGILTNAQFPELIRRFLQMASVAHAHRKNAYILGKVSTALGTAVDYTEQGSGTADLLNALELYAEYTRTRWHMAVGATIEAILPAWGRLIARQDLALRVGAEGSLGVTDAQVNAWFKVRGINVQWVYDLDDTSIAPTTNFAKAMPTSITALMYPAGTFVVGTAPVISLDAVYDSVGLTTNDYLAAFFEEGLLVAQRGLAGGKVTVGLNYKGSAGFPAVGAGSGITYAAA